MQIHNYPFTDIYRKNEADNSISLIFLNKTKLSEALIFTKFSLYLINLSDNINLEGFVSLFLSKEYSNAKTSSLCIDAITSTDINDIIYIKLSNGYLIVMTYTLDNYSGDSYQHLRIITEDNNSANTPLNITEYEKFNKDFESENACEVLDLRFI